VPYYWQLHQHWRPSVWTRPYRPAYYNYGYVTTGGGLTIGGGSIAYANPFYSTPGQYGFDYSQPLQLPGQSYQETNEDLILSERAIQRFDLARERFALGDYNGAAKYVDEAIRWLPNDPTLHQFRALTFFARKRYREAAAVLYSVLAVSPGWDTATVTNLYDTPERYLMQVNQLAQYAATHPDAVETQFLLAYHYAITGDLASAFRQLQIVNAARPNDRVVKSLMSAIR
jgi:tetratricopeptide (TPR) repeat protein